MDESKLLGFSVSLFMPQGDPSGIRIVKRTHWSGVGVVFPRALIKQALDRDKLVGPGVYFLIGSEENGYFPEVYIGETDKLQERIKQQQKKDYWTWAVVFTSRSQTLNKAHVKYIESRLVEIANEAKRCKLINDKAPLRVTLSEEDTADCESFLRDMLLCLPVIGLSAFRIETSSAAIETDLMITGKGVKAWGRESNQGFLVRKGSKAVKAVAQCINESTSNLRTTLLEQGVLREKGDSLEFTQYYVFSSPSLAAGVVLGRPSNGRVEWKDKSGKTLREIQEGEIGSYASKTAS